MKPLISRNNINDYKFDTETCVAYIHALQMLHSDQEIDLVCQATLRKAKLYGEDKLRVFNYKRAKRAGYSLSKEVKGLFMLWGLEELSATTWMRNKTLVESMQLLVNKYGVEMMQKAIHILVPMGNEHEYIKTIRNPKQLLDNYGEPYIERFKSENLFKSKSKFIEERKQELASWNTYNNHNH